jgi:hypothetical protein
VPKVDSSNGVWLNARDVVSFGLPLKHSFEDVGADVSWRIAVDASGPLIIRYVDGRSESFVVKAGDKIIAIGDHIYMSLQVPPGTPPGALIDKEGVGAETAA